MARTGVMIVATGGPGSIGDIEGFLKAASGVEPSAAELEAATRRYLAIGGVSPVPAVAERVAAALELRLNGLPPNPVEFNPVDTLTALTQTSSGRAAEGVETRVLVGMRAARPTIIDALEAFKADGTERVVRVDLAPFETPTEAALNAEAVGLVAAALGIEVVSARGFDDADRLTELLSLTYRETIDKLLGEDKPVIVFTAKAVPSRVAHETGYAARIEEAVTRMAADLELGAVDADGILSLLGIRALGGPGTTAPWLLAYQSAEAVEDAVGPDLFAVIDAAAERRYRSVAALPIGLAFDEVETMWTLDILAADKLLGQEMEFERAGVANDNESLIEAIESVVREVL
jgi:protoheme ferro-lyase